jgi:hypothetical protein
MLLKPGEAIEESHYDYDFQLLPPTYENDGETVKS